MPAGVQPAAGTRTRELVPAQALPRILYFVMGLAALTSLGTLLRGEGSLQVIAVPLTIGVVAAVGLWGVRIGQPRWAVRFLVSAVWLSISASVLFFGGPRSAGYFAYVALVLLTGLLWSERAALVFGILSCAAAGAFALASTQGLLPAPIAEATEWRLLASFTSQIAVVLLTLRYAMRAVQRGLSAERESAAAAIRSKRDAERRVRQQTAIARLGQLALATRDIGELLDDFTRTVAETLESEFTKVLELSPDGRTLLLRSGVGWRPGLVGTARVPNDSGSQAGFTLGSQLPVFVTDLERETRFVAPELLADHGIRSGISVVIAGDGPPFGVLATHSRTPGFFHEEDALFLHTAANLLSTALARFHLEAQLARGNMLEALGRLAGGVSHDFNNFLTVILGYADGMAQETPGFDPVLVGKEIRGAAERASALTRDLLAFSRQEPAKPRVIDFNEVVPRSARMLERLVGEDVRLELRLATGPCPIHADPSQIERILVNLVLNARDALPRGGLITIETVAPKGVDGTVTLIVTDTGVGMTPSVVARAMEPFFSTKGPGEGSGLGLSTVHGLVEQLRGEIHVASTPGLGTRFEIELPWAADRHDARAISPQDRPEGDRANGETILLAEDDEQLRRILSNALVAEGYGVLEARDGIEARSILERHRGPIDALVTDLVMPDSGGFEVAASLRERRPGTPVVYMSGYAGNPHAFADIEREGAVLLSKPFRLRELKTTLRKALAASA